MKRLLLPLIISIFLSSLFFYQIFAGKIPFPGDLLVNSEPYKSISILGFVPGSIPTKYQGPDVIKELLPWKKFAVESLKSLSIPFWNPNNFSGNPLMANFQSGVFYPGNFIFLFINFNTAWTLYIFLTPVLSIYFMYLFLRRLKLGFTSAIFGGVTFAFSLYMTVWIEYGNIGHTLLWLPLALFFTDRILAKVNRINYLGLIMALFCASLAGYIQGLFYIYAVIIFYFLIKGKLQKFNIRRTFIFIAALGFPILLTLFQILPTLELFSASTRGNYSISQVDNLLNPVWYLVTVAAPDFFGNPASRNFWFNGTYIERVSYFGLVPLIFALFSIFSIVKKTEVKIFSIIFAVTLLLSTNLIITKFFYLIPIPVISTTVPTRILSLFAFAGAVLAAFGLNEFLEVKNRRKFFYITITSLFFAVLLFGFTLIYGKLSNDASLAANLSIAKRNLIMPILTATALLVLTIYFHFFKVFDKYKKSIFVSSVLIISVFELFYYFQKITPFAPKEYMYPDTPVITYLKKNAGVNRFWGYGSGYIESNFQTFDNTFSPEGNDPLHIREYTELLSSSKNGYIPDILPRPDANIAGGFGKEELANNPYRQKILNITGIKYVLSKDDSIRGAFNPDYVTFPEKDYRLLWQDGYWQVYENLGVTSRYFLTTNYEVIGKGSKTLHRLFSAGFNEKKSLLLNEDPKIKTGELNSSVSLVSYTANKVVISAKNNIDALLFLSDNYYPGWEARVDNDKSKIYVADYTFRAVKVPAGNHIITFEFVPKNFYYGLYISLAALVMLVFFVFRLEKYEK